MNIPTYIGTVKPLNNSKSFLLMQMAMYIKINTYIAYYDTYIYVRMYMYATL